MAQVIEVERDLLLQAVRSAGEVLQSRSRKPMCDRVRLLAQEDGSLLVAGTAPGALVKAQVPCQGQGKFDLHLGQKALFRLVKALPEQAVKLSGSEGVLEVQSGKRKLELQAEEGGEYDLVPEEIGKKKTWARAPGKDFGASLQMAASCAWPDVDRPVLHSVALALKGDHLQVVASDSYRLLLLPLRAKVSLKSQAEPALLPLLPAKALSQDLQRRKPEEVFIERWGEGEAQGVTISYDDVSWQIALQAGDFPDWEELLPKAGHEISLRSAELREALSGVEAFGSTRKASRSSAIGALRLHLGKKIVVHYERPGTGSMEEELQMSLWQGEEEMIFGANPEFLLDAVRIFSGQEILRAWAEAASKPLLFDDDDGRAYLLMPVRLQEIEE